MELEQVIYQFEFVESNWIGCPRSPGCLSVTELTIVRIPPRLLVSLIVLGVAAIASLYVGESLT